jgi:hypothetical protein
MNERLIAWAQIALSVLFLTGYFTVLILFMLGFAKVPTDYKEAFAGLLSLMTGGGLTVLYFWFQRSRTVTPEPTVVAVPRARAPPADPFPLQDPPP